MTQPTESPELEPISIADSRAASASTGWGETWQTSRRHFLALAGLAGAGAAIGLGAAGCGTAQTGNKTGTQSKGRGGTAGDTLFVAGFQWGPPTSFNPNSASPAWPSAQGQSQLIYETLVRFNLLDGSLQPGLGKEVQETDATTLTVPLQDGTKWADGTALTAEDIVFTFEIAKSGSLSYSNVWTYLESVTAKDPTTVVFKAKSKPLNLLAIKNVMATALILPKHIWSSIVSSGKLLSDTNLTPVGSGPFKLDKADQTQVNLKRNDSYWGKSVYGTPPMSVVNHPIFKSNQDGDLKLESGDVDASQQFTAQIWKMWQTQKKPVGTWLKEKPYYLPGSLPSLIFNLSKKGLDNVKVRRAIAYAINYPNIASTAMSDYSDPVQPSMILPKGYESKFFDQAAVQKDGWSYDPAKAKEILENELGAKKGSDGIYVLSDGTRLGPWTLITPTGWTDWNTSCEIVAKSAKAVGIDISTSFPQAPQMINSMQNQNFDLCMYSYSGVSPASPWSRFRDMMDIRGVPAAGKTAFQNYNRFTHPEVSGLLDTAGAATTDEARKAAYQRLDEIFRQQLPIVPLLYRPLEFYEYNESNWTNFPDEKNPYAPPMWQGAGIQWLFKLKKVGS